MKKLMAIGVGAVTLVAASFVPAQAGTTGASIEVAGPLVGNWGNGLGLYPLTMSVGFSGDFSGVAAVAPTATPVSLMSCLGFGTGSETVASGTGTMTITCVGSGTLAPVSLYSGKLPYQRLGTEMVISGPATLHVGGSRRTITVRFAYTLTPSTVWVPNSGGQLRAYEAEGVLAGDG